MEQKCWIVRKGSPSVWFVVDGETGQRITPLGETSTQVMAIAGIYKDFRITRARVISAVSFQDDLLIFFEKP